MTTVLDEKLCVGHCVGHKGSGECHDIRVESKLVALKILDRGVGVHPKVRFISVKLYVSLCRKLERLVASHNDLSRGGRHHPPTAPLRDFEQRMIGEDFRFWGQRVEGGEQAQ